MRGLFLNLIARELLWIMNVFSPLRLLLLVFWYVVASEPNIAKSASEKPNIVFVLIDDFGYADSEPYGAKDVHTPNMSRISASGIRFTDFYSNAPVCTPARVAFITGRWQQRYGFEWAMGYAGEAFQREGDSMVRMDDMHGAGLSADIPSLPKALRSVGYVTGAFGKWHLGYRDEFNPLHHGFDEYFGGLLGHFDYYNYHYYDGTYALRDGLKPVKAEGYFTDLVNQRATNFVSRHAKGKKPFFLYVPHLAVHSPYQPPGRPKPSVTQENIDKGDRAAYVGMVEKVDEGIGMIIDELKANGIFEDTLIVISSDNGGAHFSDNSPLFNRKTSIWEGGIRVPCMMSWPTRLSSGVVSSQVGITMDLTATFAAVAGADFPSGHELDGINLLPVLTGETTIKKRTLFWRTDSMGRKEKAIRHGQWKYVRDTNLDLLFDLSVDVGERNNLFWRRQDIVADLKNRLAAWEAELEREKPRFLVK